jgi:hypothetical protein
MPNLPKGSQPNPKEVAGVLHERSRIRPQAQRIILQAMSSDIAKRSTRLNL